MIPVPRPSFRGNPGKNDGLETGLWGDTRRKNSVGALVSRHFVISMIASPPSPPFPLPSRNDWATQDSGGSFVTMVSPEGEDFSMVLETGPSRSFRMPSPFFVPGC